MTPGAEGQPGRSCQRARRGVSRPCRRVERRADTLPRRRSWRLPAWPPLSLRSSPAPAAAWWFWPGEADRSTLVRTPDQNVLLVTIDTLRADALGCYGGRAATPNLDGLAADGVRYDFAHAHAVVTLPSHVSILSGLYPFQHGVRDNSGYRSCRRTYDAGDPAGAQGFATGGVHRRVPARLAVRPRPRASTSTTTA